MFDLTCRVCGRNLESTGAGDLCSTCAAATSIATAEHAVQAKIVTTPAGAIREGEPPSALPVPAPSVDLGRAVPGWLFVAGGSLVVLTGLLVLVLMVAKVREAAARTQSISNLKQTGLAFHGFHDQHKRLPFNGTRPAAAGDATSGSWAFQILPFIDQKPLFDQPNTTTPVLCYVCPGRGRPVLSNGGAWTDYFINPWLNDPNGAVNVPDNKRRMVGITDGTSNTIFVGHGSIDPNEYSSSIAFAQSTDIFQGGSPALARRETINRPDTAGAAALTWGSPFPQGALMALGDATVRMFSYRHHSGGLIQDGVSTRPDKRKVIGDGQKLPDDFNWGLGSFLIPVGGETTVLPDS